MIWQNYKLGNTISKAPEPVTLWKTERCIIEISSDTLAVPIKLDDEEKGYMLHGHGKLLLDAIVETGEGAIGKSIEKELDEPFLMLGDTKEMQEHFTESSKEDIAAMSYENQQEFLDKAEDLCSRFFREREHNHQSFNGDHGFIFAFPNEAENLDILVAKNSKLVYKAEDIVFVSNKDKVVLKSQGEVICKNNGKSVVIQKDKSVILKKTLFSDDCY